MLKVQDWYLSYIIFAIGEKNPAFAGTGSFTEVKELLGADLQHLAELENHIEGHADVAQLDGGNVASVNIDQLGQLELGQALFLAVVHDVQPELLVVFFVFGFSLRSQEDEFYRYYDVQYVTQEKSIRLLQGDQVTMYGPMISYTADNVPLVVAYYAERLE